MRPRVTMPRWPAWVMGAAAAACAYPAVTTPAPVPQEQHQAPEPHDAPAETVDTNPASLAGTRWVLREIGAQPVVPGPPATLNFEARRFGGHGGCNNYGGRYRIHGRRIVVEEVASTLIGCQGPVGETEQRLFRGLGGAFEIAHRPGRTLTIVRDRRAALLFVPAL